MKMIKRTIGFFLLSVNLIFANDAKAVLAVIMPSGADFDSVYSGLKRELDEDYVLKKFALEPNTNTKALIQSVIGVQPKALIALDNTTLDIVKDAQADKALADLPVFAGAMLQVKQEVERRGIKHACGVQFEVPAFTQFSNLKQISQTKFLRVSVIYRKEFQDMITVSKEQLAKENIELKPYCVDCENKLSDDHALVKALKDDWKTIEADQDMVVWVLADNGLLTATTMKDFWMEKLPKSKVPIVSPLEMFVNGQKPLGELAMLALSPDFVELGSQLGNLVQNTLGNDGDSQCGFEPLVSVKKYLNKKKFDKIHWELNKDNLEKVDRIY